MYINNSLHLARRYARIFVRGHYLVLSVPSSRKTVSFEEKMSKDNYPTIFLKSNEGYCVYYLSNIFRNTRDLENWEISRGYSSALAKAYSVT